MSTFAHMSVAFEIRRVREAIAQVGGGRVEQIQRRQPSRRKMVFNIPGKLVFTCET